jgi:hypothetical protein
MSSIYFELSSKTNYYPSLKNVDKINKPLKFTYILLIFVLELQFLLNKENFPFTSETFCCKRSCNIYPEDSFPVLNMVSKIYWHRLFHP